jgi:hypothetical protein
MGGHPAVVEPQGQGELAETPAVVVEPEADDDG